MLLKLKKFLGLHKDTTGFGLFRRFMDKRRNGIVNLGNRDANEVQFFYDQLDTTHGLVIPSCNNLLNLLPKILANPENFKGNVHNYCFKSFHVNNFSSLESIIQINHQVAKLHPKDNFDKSIGKSLVRDRINNGEARDFYLVRIIFSSENFHDSYDFDYFKNRFKEPNFMFLTFSDGFYDVTIEVRADREIPWVVQVNSH